MFLSDMKMGVCTLLLTGKRIGALVKLQNAN